MIRARAWVLCLLIATAACRTTSPSKAPSASAVVSATTRGLPPGMRAADDARADLVAVVTVAPLPRVVREADDLGKRLGLPLSLGEQVLGLVGNAFGKFGWRVDAGDLPRLSPDRPVVMATIGDNQGVSTQLALAVTYRDEAAAREAVAKLGAEQRQERGLRVFAPPPRKSGDGLAVEQPRVFVAMAGPSVLLGLSPSNVFEAGAIAAELAAGSAPSHAVVHGRFLIEPLAKKYGVDPAALPALGAMGMSAALAKAGEQAKAEQMTLTPEMTGMITAATSALLQPIAEATAATMSLDLSSEQGLVFRTTLEPKAGTPLATSAASTTPATLDARLPIAATDAMVMTWEPMPRVAEVFRTVLGNSGKNGRKTQEAFNRLAEVLTGAGSCVATPRDGTSQQSCVWQVAPGVSPAVAADRFTEVVRSSSLWMGSVLGTKPPKVTTKRSKGGIVTTVALSYAGMPKKMAAQLRRSFGPRGLLHTGAVPIDGAVVVWQSLEPRQPHDVTAAAPRPPADHPLHAALARSRGADAFAYVEPMSLMRAGLTDTDDPQVRQAVAMFNALPGFAKLTAPFVMSYRGGTAATTEVQIPTSSLASVTDVLGPFFGMMGAAAGGAPKP